MHPKNKEQVENVSSGVIQYVSKDIVIASKGGHLLTKDLNSSDGQYLYELPISLGDKISSANRWLSRLSRREVHHIIKIKDRTFACFAFGKVYLIDEVSGKVEKIGTIKGSRPLTVCSDGENIYYGVYTGNKERKPIELFTYSIEKKAWSVFHNFRNIRHIHGVFWDKYSSQLWATTGDLDHESTIWRFNKKGNAEKVVTGSQQTRAVDLLFTEDATFYATDAPHDPNYIYKLDRATGKIKKLQKVGGPVFYGRKAGDWLFFSTVVEPSEVNRKDAVELWGSNDEGDTWQKIKEFKKDLGHLKLFQYGQIKFPSGPGDEKKLWFSPYATEYDHKVIRLPLNSL